VILRIKDLIAMRTSGREEAASEREMCELFGSLSAELAVREALRFYATAEVSDVRHGSGIILNDVNEKLLSSRWSRRFCRKKRKLLNLQELRKKYRGRGAVWRTARKEDHIVKWKASQ
jgi:DNA-binding FadR family transcriptional regulator